MAREGSPFSLQRLIYAEWQVNKQIINKRKGCSLSEDGWSRRGPRQFHDLRCVESLGEVKSTKIRTLLQT